MLDERNQNCDRHSVLTGLAVVYGSLGHLLERVGALMIPSPALRVESFLVLMHNISTHAGRKYEMLCVRLGQSN
ncbi:hypothetical protein TRL7639_04042 [Falsiruegeria litorea R37]|uniref:Uncharacterized protein n=1 Tax=Falsiruegeria litorea R37 TaxID=1200284 RepID=A0A1Y5TVN2_9RHOB|nr:hypothetical protein TRL7639_04042 [Falsiruegeria litorea R37]